MEVEVPANPAAASKQLVDLGLPRGALVVLLSRGGEFIVPQGSATLEKGDKLPVLGDKDEAAAVQSIVAADEPGADTAPEGAGIARE